MAAGAVLLLGLLPAGMIGPTAPWLLLLVAPVVLLVPGLYLVRALALRRSLDVEALALSVGLSIVACVLAGIILHILGRLDRSGWAIVYAAATYLLLHHERHVLTRRSALRLAVRARAVNLGARELMLAAAVVLTLAALANARSGAAAHREFAFTELWSLPARPQDLSLVEVGIRNMEKHPQGYTLDAIANGLLVGRRDVPELAHGESWRDLVPIPAPFDPAGVPQSVARVELHLHRAGEDSVVYRKTILSMPVAEEDRAGTLVAAERGKRAPPPARNQPKTEL